MKNNLTGGYRGKSDKVWKLMQQTILVVHRIWIIIITRRDMKLQLISKFGKI